MSSISAIHFHAGELARVIVCRSCSHQFRLKSTPKDAMGRPAQGFTMTCLHCMHVAIYSTKDLVALPMRPREKAADAHDQPQATPVSNPLCDPIMRASDPSSFATPSSPPSDV